MSTRSIIAYGNDLKWSGRYAHCDGYPAWMGTALWQIIKRDGVEAAVNTLIKTTSGWSSVNPSITMAEFEDTYSYRKELPTFIEGFGIPYGTGTCDDGEWLYSTDTDKWGTEWLYVIGDTALIVEKVQRDGGTIFVGEFFYDEEDPDFVELESSGWIDRQIKLHQISDTVEALWNNYLK